jgi:hypothetical protein
MAWSTLVSAFAPILLILVFGGRLTQTVAISMLIAIIWRLLNLHLFVYEGMLGILTGLLICYVWNTCLIK